MKEIIKNFYLVAFRLLGGRTTAYYIALVLASILSITALTGVSMLLATFPAVQLVQVAFKFPFIILTGAAVAGLLFYTYPSSVIATRNSQKKPNYLLLLLTIIVVVAIYGYSWFVRVAG